MSTPVATTCPKCQQRDSETYEDDDWSPEYACQHCGYESSDAWEFLGTRGVVTPGSGLDDPAVLP